MPERSSSSNYSYSADWLIRGVLTKLGDTFDRLTGRGWKPSSSLATSELIERLKQLLDAEAREEDGRKYVPHKIMLKMQWDKFSADSDDSLKKLEHELLVAAVDHINDKLYLTHAPLTIDARSDYFTSGVKLFVSFDRPGEDEHEAEMNVTLPESKLGELVPEPPPAPAERAFTVSYQAGGKRIDKRVVFTAGSRKSVGRTKENDIFIDDNSVSKAHASLVLNSESRLMVADTGSTNGTFINGERISYGKAYEITEGTSVRFGAIDVDFVQAGADGSQDGEAGPISRPRETSLLSDEPVGETREPDLPLEPTKPFIDLEQTGRKDSAD